MGGVDPRGGQPRPPLSVRAFPVEDEGFQGVVRASVSRAYGRGRLASLADRVQVDVRNRYPDARIRVQDPIAATDDELVVYAYRDGSLLRSTARERPQEAEPEEAQVPAVAR